MTVWQIGAVHVQRAQGREGADAGLPGPGRFGEAWAKVAGDASRTSRSTIMGRAALSKRPDAGDAFDVWRCTR